MNQTVRITVLGVSSLRYGPAVCGGLACYFGELPLEIRFWDTDEERLDLFDLFARYLFKLNSTPHLLLSTRDLQEALDGADAVVIAIDDPEWQLPTAAAVLPVLDLRDQTGLPSLSEEEVRAWPHTIMRYLRGDEYAFEFLKAQENSPVRTWLRDHAG